MAYDEPDYKVLEKENNIEIRHYDETAVAEVTREGSRGRSGSSFMTLFRYINGANKKRLEIPMTVPVTQKQEYESIKIPMTVPVTRKSDAEGNRTMAFYMPSDMSFDEVPEPLNDEVKIRKIDPRTIAAIKFSGWMNRNNIEKHRQVLESFLKKKGLKYQPTYLAASYNHPMTPPHMRRNEVFYILSKSIESEK